MRPRKPIGNCPECGMCLWHKSRDKHLLYSECHYGHAFRSSKGGPWEPYEPKEWDREVRIVPASEAVVTVPEQPERYRWLYG